MRYAEYSPAPRFAALVERFWLLEGQAVGAPDAIIPDGRVELIFHYGGTFWRHRSGCDPIRQPAALLVGQMLEPVVLAPGGHGGSRRDPAAAGGGENAAGILAAGSGWRVRRARRHLPVGAARPRAARRGAVRRRAHPRARALADLDCLSAAAAADCSGGRRDSSQRRPDADRSACGDDRPRPAPDRATVPRGRRSRPEDVLAHHPAAVGAARDSRRPRRSATSRWRAATTTRRT